MERKNCRIKEDYDGIKMRAEKISEAMNWRINDWNKIDEIKKERDLYQEDCNSNDTRMREKKW